MINHVDTTNLYSYLISKGLHVADCGNDQWRGDCPLCHKKDHFYINKYSGLWDCKSGSCSERGSLPKLRSILGDPSGGDIVPLFPELALMGTRGKKEKPKKVHQWGPYQTNMDLLLMDEKQMGWLQKERGLTIETIQHFKLGLKSVNSIKKKLSPKNGNIPADWITIPLFMDGAMMNIKYRTGGGYEKDFAMLPESYLPLFNHDGAIKGEPLILCEGEFDAMILWQMGFKNVLSTTAGAGSFKTDWYDYVVSLKPQIVYIAYDMDDAGNKGAMELLSRLGEDLARIVKLTEGKDPTDYFVKYGHSSADFQTLLDNASLEEIEYVQNSAQVLDQIILDFDEKGLDKDCIPTQYPNLNKLIGGGFFPGELVVMSARPKVGKTTLAQNICYHITKDLNLPILFMCLEMRPERLMRKMVSMSMEVDDGDLTKTDFEMARGRFADLPFYYSYPYKDVNFEMVAKIFEKARKRFGIKLAVFDNLHFLCRDIRHITQEIGSVSRNFKLLAERLNIPILLIVQPRKGNPKEMMSSEDFKDSSSIKQDCDKTILLHRDSMITTPDVGMVNDLDMEGVTVTLSGSLSPITVVTTDASRFSEGGRAMLWFEGAQSRFRLPTFDEIREYSQKREEAEKEEKRNQWSTKNRHAGGGDSDNY